MKSLVELKTAISEFRRKNQEYRDLLVKSRDIVRPVIVKNQQQIGKLKSELNAEYGKLEDFIMKYGNNPKVRNGVNPEYYYVYSNAFSNDILLRVGPSVEAVIQDLDYIIGKLSSVTEKDFKKQLELMQGHDKHINSVSETNKLWRVTNPLWLLWILVTFAWKHKLISLLIVFLGLIAIDYSLAGKNIIWIRNFIMGIFTKH